MALGKAIEATEDRSAHLAERIVQVEDTMAAHRYGQVQEADPQAKADPAGLDQTSQSHHRSGASLGKASAVNGLEQQTQQINAMDDRLAALGQPTSHSKRLRAPKLEADAPIGQRLDALEAYLANIQQKLDSIEERLVVLEQAAGIAPPAPDITLEGYASEAAIDGNRSDASSKSEPPIGRFVGNIVSPRKPRVPSQSQA